MQKQLTTRMIGCFIDCTYADSQNNIVLSKPYDSKEEAESNILEKDNSVGYTLLRTAVARRLGDLNET